jgi:hypothetical protein
MFKVGLLFALIGYVFATPILNSWPSSPYHYQDASGSYRYGYSSPYHSKTETRSNGITQGGYSYIDANGILQTTAYTADAINGFRVRASNLPQSVRNPLISVGETPEVAAARRRHLAEYERIENSLGISRNNEKKIKNPYLLSSAEASSIDVPRPHLSLTRNQGNPIYQYNYNRNSVPSASSYVVPIVPHKLTHSSLHHTQDSLGQYDYSYAGDTSAKSESRSLDGTTRGAYSYIDANGILQQVHYIADHNGFRVLATNLPEAR